MTNVGVNGFPSGASGAVADGSVVAGKLASPLGWGRLATGYYYFTHSASNVTNATLTTGRLRLVPWFVPNAVTISKIGAEVQSAGESGSKFRLGIYTDSAGVPGSLVLDAGTIAGDSNTVQEISVNQALSPGLYWVGGATQVVSVTQPTMKVTNTPTGLMTPASSSTPASALTVVGVFQDSVTGALPAVFTVGGFSANAARVFVKV